MSTMLLESALAELSPAQPNAGDGSRPPAHPAYRDAHPYPDMRTPTETERSKSSRFPPAADAFLPSSTNAEANSRPGFGTRSYSSKHSSMEIKRQPPTRSRSYSVNPPHANVESDQAKPALSNADRTRSTQMNRRRSPPSNSSLSSNSASPRAFSEAPSDADDGGESLSTRRVSTYEKQISIDPHSVSYRRTPSSIRSVWESNRGTTEPGEVSALAHHLQPLSAGLARSSTSDVSTAPHSPRSINFPGKMRSYLRGRLSVPDLAQVSPFADTLNSDYSSDRSSSYSIAESPISTLDLHRSPLNVDPPSPPPDYYYEAIYVPPPAPPPPRFRTLSANAGGAARSLFSAPLPQPQRMASYKKTMSFQVREVDDFTYGREERYKVTRADIVERPPSLRRDANVQSIRGMSLERRHHSLQEMIENPRSSSADMSCCSFLPFLGGPKTRITKQPSQLKRHVSPAPSQRISSQRSFYDIAFPPSDGFAKQNLSSEQFSLSAEAEAIFREPSVMERFDYRNSSSTGEIYAEGEEDDCDEETDADEESSKIERAEEVLLSFNEAYSPVASAFVFRPNDNMSTRTTRKGEVFVMPRKALKGSNGAEGAAAGTRPAFRRVRFNLESTEEVEQEVESVISSSVSNSRDMTDMMTNMGPSSLSRSTTRRAWDDLLIADDYSRNEYGQSDTSIFHRFNDGDDNLGVYGNPQNYARAQSLRQHQADLFMTLLNGAMPSESSSKKSYKPMLFHPDLN